MVWLSWLCAASAFLSRGPLAATRHVSHTARSLDIFGLGPAEVVIIAAAAAALYGPGRLKEQLREKGIKGGAVSQGFKAEREERIAQRTEAAERARKFRSWERINEALANDDSEISSRLAEYESTKSSL